jgi:hypothetical protein
MSRHFLPELYIIECVRIVSPVLGISAAQDLQVTPPCGLLSAAEASPNWRRQCPAAVQCVLHSALGTEPPDAQHPPPVPVTQFTHKTTEQHTIQNGTFNSEPSSYLQLCFKSHQVIFKALVPANQG